VLLVPLARTRVTPNQVTLATLVVFVAGAAMLAVCPARGALVGAVAILELSYVLDCVDGQLARMKGTSSPVGAHLDFLMDEIKAFVLVAAVAIRLWRGAGGAASAASATFATSDLWLLEGLLGLAAVATAISLTTFVRRPEYAAATGATVKHGAGDYGEGFDAAPAKVSRSPLALVEKLGAFLAHYPSYILFVAIANRMDLFLHVYAGLHAAYAARSLLGVARKLGRAAPRGVS
jgi:hypothetical protein